MNDIEKKEYFTKLNNQYHLMGRIMLLVAYLMMFAAPFLFSYILGSWPNLAGFIGGFLNVAVVFLPISIVEFLVYSPMMGVGGTYIGFLTGNLTNVRIPCLMNARDIAKTKPGSAEEEVISTLSVASSAVTTILVVFAGVLVLAPVAHILENPLLAPAFDNVVAALFGALGLKYFMKQPKVAVVPLVLMTLLCILVPALIAETSILIIPAGLLAMGIGVYLVKKGKIQTD